MTREPAGLATGAHGASLTYDPLGAAVAGRHKQDKQDLVAWLADLGEGAIQRLSEAPGADRALQALKGLGERVDDLQRRRGLRGPREAADGAREAGRFGREAEAAEAEDGISCSPAEKRPDAEEALTARLRRRGSRRRREEQPADEVGRRWKPASSSSTTTAASQTGAGSEGAATRWPAQPRRAHSAAHDRSARTKSNADEVHSVPVERRPCQRVPEHELDCDGDQPRRRPAHRRLDPPARPELPGRQERRAEKR